MYIFNTLGICYCLLKQEGAYIINDSACIINVWGYTEIFPLSLFQGRTFKEEHSTFPHTARKSTESEFVFAMSLHSAKRRHAKRFHTLCFKYEFPVLYFRLCRLFVVFVAGRESEFVFLLRSVIYISLEFVAHGSASKVMLSGKNNTDLKDMFNSRYIYNKPITA